MLHTVAAYFRMVVPFLYLIGSWRFGDWRNWKKYYPTALYIVCVDFFVSLIMYDYPLWTFHGALLIPNHTVADFLISMTVFTQIAFIYLSNYPFYYQWYKQVIYIAFWVIFEVVSESIFMHAKLITYDHGWNFGWSILVWVFMFIGLRLHQTKPLLAWLLCFAGVAFLILYFHIPITEYR
jgi:hypothetical protein